MLKNKRILLGILVLLLLLIIPSMVKADNSNPTVKTEVSGANKAIKVILENIELDDLEKEYEFGVSNARATDPVEWLPLQEIGADSCIAIITPEKSNMKTILRTSNKCYLFIREKDSGTKVITTQVDLSLPLENALDITKDNDKFLITYLYKNDGTLGDPGSYYMTAVKVDDTNIIKKYLEAKNTNQNTLDAVKNLIDTDIPSTSWKKMDSYVTYSNASIGVKDLITYEGLYIVWGQVSYSEGRSIYGYTLYDNYPNGYKLPEESGSDNKTPSGTTDNTDKTPTTQGTNNNNTDKTQTSQGTNNNTDKTQTSQGTTEKKDTTTATSKMPYTGRIMLAWIIGIVTVSTIVAHVRYKKLYM